MKEENAKTSHEEEASDLELEVLEIEDMDNIFDEEERHTAEKDLHAKKQLIEEIDAAHPESAGEEGVIDLDEFEDVDFGLYTTEDEAEQLNAQGQAQEKPAISNTEAMGDEELAAIFRNESSAQKTSNVIDEENPAAGIDTSAALSDQELAAIFPEGNITNTEVSKRYKHSPF